MDMDIGKYTQAWVMYHDELALVDIGGGYALDEGRLIEARLADGSEEMHIWRDEDGGLASKVHAFAAGGDAIDNEYRLLRHFGKSITLKDIIGYDDDGQAYVAYTAFAGFEGGN